MDVYFGIDVPHVSTVPRDGVREHVPSMLSVIEGYTKPHSAETVGSTTPRPVNVIRARVRKKKHLLLLDDSSQQRPHLCQRRQYLTIDKWFYEKLNRAIENCMFCFVEQFQLMS